MWGYQDFRSFNASENHFFRKLDFAFDKVPLLVWRSWFHESSWSANCSANRLSHSQIFLLQAPPLFVQTILFFPVSASSTRSAEYPTSSPRHLPSCVTLLRFKIMFYTRFEFKCQQVSDNFQMLVTDFIASKWPFLVQMITIMQKVNSRVFLKIWKISESALYMIFFRFNNLNYPFFHCNDLFWGRNHFENIFDPFLIVCPAASCSSSKQR